MEGFGSGDFVIDWDAADTLPQHDNNVGQMAFTYSRMSPTATVTNNVAFTNILDNCDPANCSTHGQIFDARLCLRGHAGLGRRPPDGATENSRDHHRGQGDAGAAQSLEGDGAGRSDVRVDRRRRRQRPSTCLQRMLGLEFRLGLQRASSDPSDTAGTGAPSRAARCQRGRSSRCRRNESKSRWLGVAQANATRAIA